MKKNTTTKTVTDTLDTQILKEEEKMNLLERLELARNNGPQSNINELRESAEWWIINYGSESIDLTAEEGKIAKYYSDVNGGSDLYIWLGAESGEWYVMRNCYQGDTVLLSPVSLDDEKAIEGELDSWEL